MSSTTPTWRPRKITIQCERGKRLINANVLGSMAMHPIRGGSAWRLTHVKTGLALKDFPRWQDAQVVGEALAGVAVGVGDVERVRGLIGEVIGA